MRTETTTIDISSVEEKVLYELRCSPELISHFELTSHGEFYIYHDIVGTAFMGNIEKKYVSLLAKTNFKIKSYNLGINKITLRLEIL